jgi:hypothetical protein
VASTRGRRRRARPVALASLVALLGLVVPAPAPAGATQAQVTGVQPNAGPNTGGTSVTIQGTGFQENARVRFGSTSVSGSVSGPSSMTATAPAVSPNYGSFAVDNPDGGRSTEQVTFNYYERLPSLRVTSSAHAATHDLVNDAQVDLFARGSDNTLHHTFHTNVDPTWAPWEGLGGVLTSSPSAVSWGNQNRIDVVAKGSDNALWHTWFNGSSWGGWESLGGTLSSDPVVTSWGTGILDVFARGTDGQLWHRHYSGSWTGWEPLGGSLSGPPGGVSWGPDRIDVFAQGTDNAVWHRWWNGADWGGWESLGGAINGQPAAASTGFGDLEVYAIGLSGANSLYHLPFSGTWQPWRAEGAYWNGVWGWDPGAVSQGFVLGVDTFEIGSEGTIWHTVTSAAVPPHAQVRGGTSAGSRR